MLRVLSVTAVRTGAVHLGSQFEGAVCHGSKVMVAEFEGPCPMASAVRKQRLGETGTPLLLLFFQAKTPKLFIVSTEYSGWAF